MVWMSAGYSKSTVCQLVLLFVTAIVCVGHGFTVLYLLWVRQTGGRAVAQKTCSLS